MNYNTHHKEVIDRINSTERVIPAQRAAYKQGFSFSSLPFDDQLPLWDYIWNHGSTYREQLHAFFYLEQAVNKKDHHLKIWQTAIQWQSLVSDWGLCDALAKVFTKLLETFPEEVYAQLTEWNKSEDLWMRRQSVVSLLYYSRTKKNYLPVHQILALIEPLLRDNEYYVQKGVGWALREVHTVYPETALPFMHEHIKNISAIAFTIAIEKMTDAEKNVLKAKRKIKVT